MIKDPRSKVEICVLSLFVYIIEIKIFEVILTGAVFYSLQQQ